MFRVGAAGSNLGRGTAAFAGELAGRLGKAVSQLHVTVVQEHDPYGDSVAGAMIAEGRSRGMSVTNPIYYDAGHPDWGQVFQGVAASRPDILVLASYIADGVAFRKAMLARGVHVGALIGSTMAECGPEFGQLLGPDAVGVFASDRPTRGFNPAALDDGARQAYGLLQAAYQARFRRVPGEEAISGFSSAWGLLVDTLPQARTLDPGGIASAAMGLDLPTGSLPNGGGLRFSADPRDLGQNLRAASVIWQWQGVNHSVTVWPPVFATGEVQMVPLPR